MTELVLLQGDQLEIDFSAIGFDVESSLSIPCTVKQPMGPELSGVIQQDLGWRFIVYLPDANSTLTVPKLFVYPDFSQLDKSSSKQSPPSKIPPSKNRRRKGEGTGYIYRRTITRRGNQYQESYYRYRDESGKLRSKYIRRRLLDKVQEAESRSLPVTEVLKLLGVNEINRGEQFSSSEGENLPSDPKSDELISLSRGEQVNNPSTKRCDPATTTVARERAPRQRRKYGYGGGYIECKPITKNGKQYKQYWFHWQVWRDGETVIKKSRYIPKKQVSKVMRMNNEKAPVAKILKVLESKSKRKK